MDTDLNEYELTKLYKKYFTMGNMINRDISIKFAFISIVAYITNKLKKKDPNVTYLSVLTKLAGDNLRKEHILGLSILIDDFAYGCDEFPTFNIPENKMIPELKKILVDWLPF